MSSAKTLADLASALLSGSVRVVDLSAPLGPETPVIQLPPQIGKNTPPVKVHSISHYDADGPYWAWNWLELGEHTGTHFDAPRHWISGKDYPDGIDRPHSRQEFRRSRQRHRSLERGGGGRGLFAHR